MDYKINDKRYSARPVVRQAGRVLSPEPRQDSSQATGRKQPQRIMDASHIQQGSKFYSGNTTKNITKLPALPLRLDVVEEIFQKRPII